MSARERTGQRDLTYSAWHRQENTRRYLGNRRAFELGMIDMDGVEWCRHCRTPLALIETQRSDGPPKSAAVTAELASMAQITAYSVSYTDNGEGCGGIHLFRVRRVFPAEAKVRDLTPDEYAEWLWSFRERHACRATEAA